MAEKNTPAETPRNEPAPANGDDVGQAEVQKKVDEITEKGYLGKTPDPLDKSHYTVAGVLASDKAAKQDRGQGEPLLSTTDESYPGGPRPAVGGN